MSIVPHDDFCVVQRDGFIQFGPFSSIGFRSFKGRTEACNNLVSNLGESELLEGSDCGEGSLGGIDKAELDAVEAAIGRDDEPVCACEGEDAFNESAVFEVTSIDGDNFTRERLADDLFQVSTPVDLADGRMDGAGAVSSCARIGGAE